MNPYGQALALFDGVLQARGSLCLVAEGVGLDGEVPEALEARLEALCGDQEGREDRASYRALRVIVGAPSRASREVLTCCVAYAVGLPVPFVITFRRHLRRCVCATARDAYTNAVREGWPAFVMRELEAAALAVELRRAGPSDLDRWIGMKLRGEWRLTPELAGVPVGVHATICFGELFDALGAELVDVELLATEAA